ncbi:putative disease resistance protein At3g14460, partial [Arachis ipaensis]|uniref:putative disease resistance protein At3g14460 n=1 Tax=Arachis ipaensis TaxID=130454 RepID=UPI000A2AFD31
IKQIHGGTCSLDDFNSLHNALKEELSNKKFFIVLDDVWSDDGDKWSNFMTPFQQNGNKGSIVLLTTREENVVSAVRNCQPYFLRKLSEDYCWSVLAENASFPQSNGRAALEEIGRKIVKKCDGLPLAAETLGRLLRTKHDVEEWNKILMSHIWGFSLEKSKIIPALLISYFHLSPHLKRCFVYCALFPKDYKFEKDKLILLWIAEDLLPPPKRGESLEEVGCECFDELTSRLFFTKIKDGNDYFVMHDLLHDLSIFLAGDFYCNSEELGEEEEIRIQTRHLFVDLSRCSSKLYNSISKVESLRTLLLYGGFSSPNCNIEAATCEILSKCTYLRVLSLTKFDLVPNSIGKLIHLRHLDLSYTGIKTLSKSLCNLSNLQTLKLYHCRKLTTLPSGLHNLVSLRHLDIRETSLKEMPRKMSKLKQLHVLSSFVVGKQEDNGIEELGGLANLHGCLEIKKLENIVDVQEAKRAKIMDKKHIDELCLEWLPSKDLVSSKQKETDILHNLQPQNGLKELKIKGYKGTIFPDWLGSCSYEKMTRVSLKSCKNCWMLPSLGQLPSLKSLSIEGFEQLRCIGEEFYKNEGDHHSSHIAPFPTLETLVFDKMPCWEVWHVSESETFPQLRMLEIRRCPMLKEEMLNQVFFGIVSSLSDVSKVRKLRIGDHFIERHTEAMFLDGDTLRIRGSKSVMESAWKAMISINHLSYLQEIRIWRCRKLEFPQLQQHKYDLVELQILDSCDSLTSLSLDAFPNLKNLQISWCRNLESVSMSEAPHAALQRLSIRGCDKLVSFAGEGLAAPNLTHLNVSRCSKLEALPRDMKSLLPSLHTLKIYGCPNICRLPEGDLPPNLKSLGVGGCEEQLRDLSWMANLHALTHLIIRGSGCDNVKSYPEVGSLPHLPSLTTLCIEYFDNLETLECNELLHLTSLQQLHISFCIKLENMEGEKLPPSLLLLQLTRCGLLGEHSKNKHQLIWSKISHIRTIHVKNGF